MIIKTQKQSRATINRLRTKRRTRARIRQETSPRTRHHRGRLKRMDSSYRLYSMPYPRTYKNVKKGSLRAIAKLTLSSNTKMPSGHNSSLSSSMSQMALICMHQRRFLTTFSRNTDLKASISKQREGNQIKTRLTSLLGSTLTIFK